MADARHPTPAPHATAVGLHHQWLSLRQQQFFLSLVFSSAR
jgi:hypothetical protein